VSSSTTRHPLETALAGARTAGGLHDAVALLAALGALEAAAGDTPTVRAALAWLQGYDCIAAELDAYLEALTPAPPEDPHALDGWIFGAESVGLAAAACERFGDAVTPAIRAAFARRIERIREDARAWPAPTWDCALVAAQTRLGAPGVVPWTEIRSRYAQGRLVAAEVDDAAIEAWVVDALHAEDAEQLRAWVRHEPRWRAAYGAVVRWLGDEIIVAARADPQTVHAASDAAELRWAEPLLSVPVPHRGVGVRFEVLRGHGGVFSRFTDASSVAFATHADGAVTWADDVLGEIRSPLRLLAPQTPEILHDVADSTAQLAAGTPHPRGLPIALAVTAGLESGLAHDALAEAAHLFATGDDGTGDEPRCAAAVLCTRAALERLGDRLEDEHQRVLDVALERADAAIGVHADGLLLLDDVVVSDCVGGDAPPAGAWWGRPRELDARVPLQVLRRELERARPGPSHAAEGGVVLSFEPRRVEARVLSIRAAEVPAEYRVAAADSAGCVSALAELESIDPGNAQAFDTAHRTLLRLCLGTAGLWRNPELAPRVRRVRDRHPSRASELDVIERWLSPQPGAVIIPAVRENGQGIVLEARVRFAPGVGLGRLGRVAHDAVARAFAALVESSPTGPRHLLEDHAIEIIGDVDLLEGASLALPIALAMASLWLDAAIPADLAASGDLGGRDRAEVRPVDGIGAKAETLDREASTTRMLCSAEQAPHASRGHVTAVPVTTLGEALAVAGLELARATFEPAWRDVQARLLALQQWVDAVKYQDLLEFSASTEPWFALAERMRLIIESLAATVGQRELLDARIHCALAFTHAGAPRAARAVLQTAGRDESMPPPFCLICDVVDLGVCVDEGEWASCAAIMERLDAELDAAPPYVRDAVYGMARGSQGNALLHLADPEAAARRHSEAVTFHAKHQVRELARSRVHLAAALRVLGRPLDALAELERAEQDLAKAREHSVAYANTTSIYLDYERARALVDMGLGLEAHVAATRALQRCDGAFWPRLGILRTLAWAHRLLGDTRSVEACLEHMCRLDVKHDVALRDRLVAEAEGPPTPRGEIY